MKKSFHIKVFIFIFLSFCVLQANTEQQKPVINMQMYNLLKGYPQYQDIIINNQVLKKGVRDCQTRYDVIKQVIDQYKRPITVLDLGARQGYYSFRIAQEHPDSTCVMVEGNYKEQKMADQLLTLCKLNNQLDNLILLNTKISLEDLNRLADCEYFDVILAFDFINTENKNWKETIDTVLRQGDNIFIEIPYLDNPLETKNQTSKKIDEYLREQNGKLLLQRPCESNPNIQNKTYWFSRSKVGLRSKHFDRKPQDSIVDLFRIESNFEHKYLFKRHGSHPITWIKGINLVTYLVLNGTYPTRKQVKNSVIQASKEHLADFAPWNMVVQGNVTALIDQSNPRWHVHVGKALEVMLNIVDKSTREDVLKSFIEYNKIHLRKRK